MSGVVEPRRLLGYLCPKRPDGPLIPPHALYDPCGHDVAVYDDGTTDPPNFGHYGSTEPRCVVVVGEQDGEPVVCGAVERIHGDALGMVTHPFDGGQSGSTDAGGPDV